jgi:hypothetical protein
MISQLRAHKHSFFNLLTWNFVLIDHKFALKPKLLIAKFGISFMIKETNVVVALAELPARPKKSQTLQKAVTP